MSKTRNNTAPRYFLDTDGSFVIENYNCAKPFVSFFPGVAGVMGTPLWCFYVNRAQAVCSFGFQDKDHAILEFHPADKAWALTPVLGFRTFVKTAARGRDGTLYEPFAKPRPDAGGSPAYQRMAIEPGVLTITDRCEALGLETRARTFTVPGEPYAALARELTVANTGRRRLEIELLDGLPALCPDGMHTYLLKNMSRTSQAWMTVENLSRRNVPFFKFKVEMLDRPELVQHPGGNFYLHFADSPSHTGRSKILVDPACVFGEGSDFLYPYVFASPGAFAFPAAQQTHTTTPCAMGFSRISLAPGSEKTLYTVIGHAENLAQLNDTVIPSVGPSFFRDKLAETRRLTADVSAPIITRTASPEFDRYCAATFLDNVLRGGTPVKLGKKSFHVFSRKHGDPERDYNHFSLLPEYFSCGNGNYRDINQNRRSDTRFFPFVGDENLRTFINLVQLDGFNPLSVEGSRYRLENVSAQTRAALSDLVGQEALPALLDLVTKPFTPGVLCRFLIERAHVSRTRCLDALDRIAALCAKTEKASHGEGFWTDHWTYNLDLIETFLSVYPERLRELLLGQNGFTFFDSDHRCRPRSQKIAVIGSAVRQTGAVVHDEAKAALIASRAADPNLARTLAGKGEVLTSTLLVKLLCLIANKTASLDPFGAGVEMEADKPNWYDALNGLPALCGSSTHETFELLRLVRFVSESLRLLELGSGHPVEVFEELASFISALDALLRTDPADFPFWDESHTIKERYRDSVFFGVSGRTEKLTAGFVLEFLSRAAARIDRGLARTQKNSLHHSYFANEVTAFDAIRDPRTGEPLKTEKGYALVRPKAFRQIPLPLFLEGQVHALKTAGDEQKAQKIYRAVRASALYDTKLRMYKVNAPLEEAGDEIGRARVFSPGWLENESVWLHMQYKYLLEILRSGLVEEFYRELRNLLIPFMDARRYGRSILENSSFIVSSAFPNKDLHGAGFVARLSGATAEFLHIWQLMMFGPAPFARGADGKAVCRLVPALASWLFAPQGAAFEVNGRSIPMPARSLGCLFLGHTPVIYHNPKLRNTFGKNAAQVRGYEMVDLHGRKTRVEGAVLPAAQAEKLRLGDCRLLLVSLS